MPNPALNIPGVPTGRHKAGRRAMAFRAKMISFIGEPNEVQEALIDRAVVLQHQIELMDAERMKAGGRMSDCAKREYLGWSNSLVRTLKQLGMEGLPASTKPTDKKFWTYEYVAKQKDIPA